MKNLYWMIVKNNTELSPQNPKQIGNDMPIRPQLANSDKDILYYTPNNYE